LIWTLLIQTEVIDELADFMGGEVRAITEAAMNGEIDFKESFKTTHFARRFKRRGTDSRRKSTHNKRSASFDEVK
jgi:phosphoserine phosphatase